MFPEHGYGCQVLACVWISDSCNFNQKDMGDAETLISLVSSYHKWRVQGASGHFMLDIRILCISRCLSKLQTLLPRLTAELRRRFLIHL